MTTEFYVLNLLRRSDRKNNFTKKFSDLGISDSFEFVEAIDGSYPISKNNYDNPRLLATAKSHYKIWELIAESDKSYGVVLEDDILFHYDFKKHWLKIKNKLKSVTSNSDCFELIYLGMGDYLPIHTEPPTKTLLDAQEKSHVIRYSVIHDYFGVPDVKSPYIFDWFGSFSYVLTKKAAQKLIKLFDSYKRTDYIDRWIKELPIKKHVTIPLLTYHPSIDTNIYDTDVTNTFMPIVECDNTNGPSTAFLIIVPNSENYNLETTILSILRNAKNPDKVLFAFRINYNDNINLTIVKNLRNGLYDKDGVMLKPTVCLIQGPEYSDTTINEEYNNLWKCFFRIADFFVCWDYDKLISSDWDFILNNYHMSNNCPKIACYQIQSNIERNVNALNSDNVVCKNINEFSTPFLTNKLAEILKGVGSCIYFNEYIKYVCYLTQITIIVKNINSTCISDHTYEDEDDKKTFFESSTVKYFINNSILDIKKSPDYYSCGMWIDIPLEWATTKTVGESKLK